MKITKSTPALLTGLLLFIWSAVGATAATFTVTNTADSGTGSLRQAVLDANAAATADTIVFDASFNVPRTITLATVIQISAAASVDNLTITGPGADLLTIVSSGSGSVRIFQTGANSQPADTTTISGITFAQSAGGNISNFGNLTVTNCAFVNNNTGVSGVGISNNIAAANLIVKTSVFSGNTGGGGSGGNGGAIANSGTATVTNSTFSSNTIGFGGAISNTGSLSVSGCTFTNNTASSGSATSLGGGAIYSFSSAMPVAVTITNSTFTGNVALDGSSGGGAIANRTGTMNISGSTFTNNSGFDGGGAVRNFSVMTISNSTFSGNSATGANAAQVGQGSGGAISNAWQLAITDSLITGNSAANYGGGIYFNSPNSGEAFLNVTSCTISNNLANTNGAVSGGDGGGIHITVSPVATTITNSTISGNSVDGNGGGISVARNLILTNCTVSGNNASGAGGGIFDHINGGIITLANSTIVNNHATQTGGIFWSTNASNTPPLNLGNTIVANNTTSDTFPDLRGSFVSQGYNLISNTTGAGITGDTATNITGVDPLLGALADNGGPTKTHALLAGSPAIDQGKSLSAATTDQRGLPRPFDQPALPNASGGDGSDIGAFEDQPPNTEPGNDITPISPSGDARCTFHSVSQGGYTTFIPIEPPSSAGIPPQGYAILDDAPAYDITTTATFTPPITVGITVASITSPAEFARVRILHGENGQLVDRTILAPDSPPPDFATRTVYARVDSLSPFVIALADSARLLNVSTRLRVQTGDNALIGGFIISGNASKRVMVRAVGPSLTDFGIVGALADPVLALNGPAGFSPITNNDWRDTQQAEIEATGIPPSNNLESAIVATLAPGAYTAVVRGQNDGTGVGLVEAYDLETAVDAKLANISTRGLVEAGENVMIGGLIAGPSGNASGQMLVRAIGPSLLAFGVPNALEDPTLELRDGSGALVASNNDWMETQQAAIEATGIPPTHNKESAILSTLAPGTYTAVVRGVGDTTGVGLVEVYNLN